MLAVGFLVPAFAGMTMLIGENRRFQPPKKVNVTRGILGSRFRGNDNAYWGEQEVPTFAGMTMFIGEEFGEVPAFAGMTMRGVRTGDSSLRWNRNAEPHDK
jgi:hypothetical protein